MSEYDLLFMFLQEFFPDVADLYLESKDTLRQEWEEDE